MAPDGAVPHPSPVPPTASPVAGTDPVPGGAPGGIPVPPAATASRQPLSGDWPAQAADAVVNLVGTVRDRTLRPVMMVARGVVYGILVLVLATMATVLLVIALVRFTDWLVPGEVWSAYLVLGVLFTALGLFLWWLRRPRSS